MGEERLVLGFWDLVPCLSLHVKWNSHITWYGVGWLWLKNLIVSHSTMVLKILTLMFNYDKYKWIRVFSQKFLMNSFIIDNRSGRLILKELDSLGVEQRARHQVWLDIPIFLLAPTTLAIDGYDKLKPFGFTIHGATDGYSWKILRLFVGSSNNDPKS